MKIFPLKCFFKSALVWLYVCKLDCDRLTENESSPVERRMIKAVKVSYCVRRSKENGRREMYTS